MLKCECFQLIIIGFFILKETSTNPIQTERLCSPSLPAQHEQFLHAVFIRTISKRELLCQGTLIDFNWVLTSAFCINDEIPLDNVYLTMGNKTGNIVRKPLRVERKLNDGVALIKMNRPVTADDNVRPIEMATGNMSNLKCVVSSIQKQSDGSASLIYWNIVNVTKQSRDKSEWRLQDTFCHSDVSSSQSILYDGALLICNTHIYGISSINNPKIFKNINNYKIWIQNIINPTASIDKTKSKILTSSDSQTLTNDIEITVSDDLTSQNSQHVTEDMETTESDDITSQNAEHVTEDLETTASDDLTSPDFQPVTEDMETTESDDQTSPDFQPVTEDMETTETDDQTSPDLYPTVENIGTTASEDLTSLNSKPNTKDTEATKLSSSTSSIKYTDYYSETDGATEYDNSSYQSSPYTIINDSSSSNQQYDITTANDIKNMYETEEDPTLEPSDSTPKEIEGTTNDQFSKQTSTDKFTAQSTTTEKFTANSIDLTFATEETFETEDGQGPTLTTTSVKKTEETFETEDGQSPTPSTVSVTETKETEETEDGQSSQPSMTTIQETEETLETEDGQVSTQTTSKTSTPQSSTTEQLTSSSKHATEITTETPETEDSQFSDQTNSETEDSTPIHFDTPPTTVSTSTITATTDTSMAATTAASTEATTAAAVTTAASTEATTAASAATSAVTNKTTKVSDAPEHTTINTEKTTESTTVTPESSSSQSMILNKNLITLLCCIMYFNNYIIHNN